MPAPDSRPPQRHQRNDPDDPLVQMNVRIPQSLRDQIDLRRSVKDMSRDRWVENALMHALAYRPQAAPLTNTRGRTAPPPHRR